MRIPFVAIVLLSVATEMPGQTECSEETIYVSMLGTRKHRLSGENPTVGLFYTQDFGVSWNHIGWEQGKSFSVYVPENSCGDTLWVSFGNGAMRSTDAGMSWRVTTGWEVTEVQDITVDPTGSGRVVAATPYGIYVSDDHGDTWLSPHLGYTSSVRFDRTDPRVLFAGTEDGLFVARNVNGKDAIDNEWRETEVTAPVRAVRQSPHDARIWAVGLQDGGVAISLPDGSGWMTSDVTSTIYEVEFHPADENTLYAGGWDTGLLVSHDRGATWTRIDALETRNVHGIAISQKEPSVIIVGSMDDGVFVTSDEGRTWSPANPDLFDQGQVWDVHIRGE